MRVGADKKKRKIVPEYECPPIFGENLCVPPTPPPIYSFWDLNGFASISEMMILVQKRRKSTDRQKNLILGYTKNASKCQFCHLGIFLFFWFTTCIVRNYLTFTKYSNVLQQLQYILWPWVTLKGQMKFTHVFDGQDKHTDCITVTTKNWYPRGGIGGLNPPEVSFCF